MITHLVTFSDSSMTRSVELCVQSAKAHGIDEAWHYEKRHVWNTNLIRVNQSLFDQPRGGGGYFAWKPAIIEDAMRRAEQCYSGEQFIVYADAGVEFLNNVNYIIDRMDQDIFLFGNQWEHAHWCKRDIINEIWPYSITLPNMDALDDWHESYVGPVTPWARFGKQVQASVIFFRVSDYSRKFVAEWLKWCLFEGGRLIDDSPSRTPNHPEFRENRHDQAILTTMAYREGIKLHAWPASYNGGAFEYPRDGYDDTYPCLFSHHRKRNHEWAIAV